MTNFDKRVIFLMNYHPNLNLEENKKIKFNILEQSDDDCYKKNCDYPDYVTPSPIKYDKDCLSVNNGLCSYLVPSPKRQVFLWKGTKINFNTQEKLIYSFERMERDWNDWGFNKWDEPSKQAFKDKWIQENLNTIRNFVPPSGKPGGGVEYLLVLQWRNWSEDFDFQKTDPEIVCYFTDDSHKKYIFPELKDPRAPWQVIMDDVEHWIYWALMAIDLAVMLFVGGPFALFFSLAIFTIVPGLYLAKAIYEGDNIGIGVNAIFMILPYIGRSKILQGISESALKEISIAASKQPLTDASGKLIEENFKTFIESLSPKTKIALQKILRKDPEIFQKELESILKDNKQNIEILKNLMRDKSIAPEGLIVKIPFWSRMWVKEIGIMMATNILSFGLNLCCSKELNNQEKQKLYDFFITSPEPEQMAAITLSHLAINTNKKEEFIKDLPKVEEVIEKIKKELQQDKKEQTKKCEQFMIEYFKTQGYNKPTQSDTTETEKSVNPSDTLQKF